MKTEQEIEQEIKKITDRIENSEHLITEAELGIKMHRNKIEQEIKKITDRIENLEHLITEAELGIKMHRNKIDIYSAKLCGIQWCLETTPEPLIINDHNNEGLCTNTEELYRKSRRKYVKEEESNYSDKDKELEKVIPRERIKEEEAEYKCSHFDKGNPCPFPSRLCSECEFFK